MSLYDLPKDMLIKLISTLQEDIEKENKYYVVRLLYKYGEYYIETFDNEEELKKYLVEDIEEKSKYLSVEIEFETDLTFLIRTAKKLGKKYLFDSLGYAVVDVFKGQRL